MELWWEVIENPMENLLNSGGKSEEFRFKIRDILMVIA